MLHKIGEFYADKIYTPIDGYIVDTHNKHLDSRIIHYGLFIGNIIFYIISYFILYLCGMSLS